MKKGKRKGRNCYAPALSLVLHSYLGGQTDRISCIPYGVGRDTHRPIRITGIKGLCDRILGRGLRGDLKGGALIGGEQLGRRSKGWGSHSHHHHPHNQHHRQQHDHESHKRYRLS